MGRPIITAARCTFSLTFSITQRDAICRRSLLPGESVRRRDRSGDRRWAKCRRCWIRTARPVLT